MVTLTVFLLRLLILISSRPEHYKSKTTHIDVELPHRRQYNTNVNLDLQHPRRYDTEIDFAERQYRSRYQPSYREEVNYTVDAPRFQAPQAEIRVGGSTVDLPRPQAPTYEKSTYTQQTVDPPRHKSDKMGYYDEDGKFI